ncbi:type VII secretion protein EccB [Streptomyces sp. TP-A0874]|uniref:type VII secretion protein EccB n=1 Tax=Streptomyces sp. TP-A0874 TaxID=549819 RepID=UPI0008529B8C|nr:type VII secretion protein EccB [Streptomyces sp. TP-A0874]
MPSRRDELNAYSFARRRAVAAFLAPSPTGSEESAPRPLRTVLPGMIIGAVLLAGFGAWGMFRPAAPKGWSAEARNVVVGSESTTRYVVLKTHGRKQLHPVLNMASARLLLDPGSFEVLKVDEKILDGGELPRGATLGIPYAPDRLPDAREAASPKVWTVCELPTGDEGRLVERTVYVLAGEERAKVEGRDRLRGRQSLFVQGPDRTRYLVTADGTSHPIGEGAAARAEQPGTRLSQLVRALLGEGARPQQVSKEWLAALNPGKPLTFPELQAAGAAAGVPGLPKATDRIGMVLTAATGDGPQHYVVLPGRIAPVSDLVARLLMSAPGAQAMYPGEVPAPQPVAPQAVASGVRPFYGDRGWPDQIPVQANTGDRTVACGVYHGAKDAPERPELSLWAGSRRPLEAVDSGTGTYVTPGTGLLLRRPDTPGAKSGANYLLTDSGLRYSIPVSGGSPDQDGGAGGRVNENQVRLGYGDTKPVEVPAAWVDFLSKGPSLDTASARQPQGS